VRHLLLIWFLSTGVRSVVCTSHCEVTVKDQNTLHGHSAVVKLANGESVTFVFQGPLGSTGPIGGPGRPNPAVSVRVDGKRVFRVQ